MSNSHAKLIVIKKQFLVININFIEWFWQTCWCKSVTHCTGVMHVGRSTEDSYPRGQVFVVTPAAEAVNSLVLA